MKRKKRGEEQHTGNVILQFRPYLWDSLQHSSRDPLTDGAKNLTQAVVFGYFGLAAKQAVHF